MQELMSQLKENLGFVLVCVLIVVALSAVSRFAERFMAEKRKVSTARRVSIIGICAAIVRTVNNNLSSPLSYHIFPGLTSG